MADRTIVRTITQTRVIIRQTSVGPKVIIRNRGPVGEDGDPGDSAYAVAVANGFVGTEAAWLASLVGPGEAGTSGNRWRTGAGLSDPAGGILGDHYLNATTDRVYRKWTKPAAWAYDAGDTSPDVAGSLAKCVLNLPLLEGSGAPTDHVSGLTGTLVNGAAWATTDGIVGIDFDGVDDKVTLPVQPIGNLDAYELGVLFAMNSATLPDPGNGALLYAEQNASDPDRNYNALYLSEDIGLPGHIIAGYERFRVDAGGKSSWLYVFAIVETARLVPGLNYLHVVVRDYDTGDADLFLNGVRLEPMPTFPQWDTEVGFDEDDPACQMDRTALGCWQLSGGDAGFLDGRIAGVFAFGDPIQTAPQLAGFLDDMFGIARDASVPVDPTGWYAMVAKVRGRDAGFGYVFNALTTNADPTGGKLKLNHASPALATALYLSETSAIAELLGSEIATWDDSTSAVRAKLKLYKTDDPTVFALYGITGALTDNGDWVTLPLTYVTGAGTFADLDAVTVLVLPTGDAGAGAGSLGLDDLTDVTITAPANGQTVIRRAGVFVNDAIAQDDVAGLVSDLAAEATTRGNADTALDGRLDVVEPLTPSSGEKAALVGTSGTPGSGNKYVTDGDARNTNARTPTAHTHPESEVTNLVTDLAGKIPATEKGAASGVATLDGGGKVPSAQLPAVAPAGSPYVTFGTDATLSNERVTTDTPTVAWDIGTAGQVKASVPDDAVTNAKAADMATGTMKGRKTAGTGDPEDLSASDARTNMGLGSLATVTPTGTPDGTKFLRDDNSWQAASGGGGLTSLEPALFYSGRLI